MGGLGLRELAVMNIACLGKLGWKLKSDNNELWCNVLRNKYNRGNVQLGFDIKASDSSLWKALINSMPALEKASIWCIGNGRTIDAWSDTWMAEGIVLEQLINIPQQLQRKKLHELVDAGGRWNWSLLQDWLPEEFLKRIAAVIPPSAAEQEDTRIMPGNSNNSFSVSNLYLNLKGYHGEMENTIWRRIWRLQVPERVKTFTWMMQHGRLLTNSLKSKMRLCHAMCDFCGDVEETILHVLRDCPRAREIWSCVITTNDRANFYMSEANHWIELNLHNTMHWNGEGSWSDFWVMCCHCIWSWRNKELFDENFVRPSRPLPVILKMVKEYIAAVNNTKIVACREKVERLVGWKPARYDYIKLNTDGAYKADQVAGCGGVLEQITHLCVN
jgi:hypothetical protein